MLAVIAAIVVPLSLWGAGVFGSKTFTITGTISLGSSVTVSLTPGFACEGSRGYSNIGPNSPVTVKDETGTLVATGDMIGSTRPSTSRCLLEFAIDEVPAGKKYYLVEIARRGELSYTEEEAREPLRLTIGD